MTTLFGTRVPNDARTLTADGDLLAEHMRPAARGVFALTRIGLGWAFLWAFLDKLFGLGFATESEAAWINGGNPTEGFLNFATRGPLAEFYQGLAGQAWVDWLFMTGLLGIGVAMMLGIGMRIAAASGALMMLMMWSAALAPENNPFFDDHIVYALVLVGLALINAGETWGFGRLWNRLDIVRRFPFLK